MIVNKQQKRAGADMESIRGIVKKMIARHIEVALANADNYDGDGNVIDDYVAADVYIAMSDDNFENVNDMIGEVLMEHEIYESSIRRVA
tara:strand:+ start:282 stop:548 length:267 start_codon:yes stop_codon:yes gene_type:complete